MSISRIFNHSTFANSTLMGLAALIGGFSIAFFTLDNQGAVYITQDSIATGPDSVMGLATLVVTLFSLLCSFICFMGDYVNYRGWSPVPRASMLRQGLIIAARYGLTVFVVMISFGVLWQRFFEALQVSALFGAGFIAILSGMAGFYIALSLKGEYRNYVYRSITPRPAQLHALASCKPIYR
ncbi:hypothetical protein [Parapusillimonas granuli]|uniref:Uncharacterized protein n=1 Tax=Parapusillimonas granuli TaxID=380911 RepID=A0A853G358_9BURK|nr:hypothetical protein [Parapusillimonas granuli]MBB5214656.1 hypothetical protein [Parapusillimonas granuli]MEB2398096.1 hypothetical protein [Alcaligenaceae bacterium]NYT48936.1 hypothetical protein [Parapusillimonas granuli]